MPRMPTNLIEPLSKRESRVDAEAEAIENMVNIDDRVREALVGKPKALQKWLPEALIPNVFSLASIPFFGIWILIFSGMVWGLHKIGFYPGPKYWNGVAEPGMLAAGVGGTFVAIAFVVLGYIVLNISAVNRNWRAMLLWIAVFPAPFGFWAILLEVYAYYNNLKPLNAPGGVRDYLPGSWGLFEWGGVVLTTISCYVPLILLTVALVFGERIKRRRARGRTT